VLLPFAALAVAALLDIALGVAWAAVASVRATRAGAEGKALEQRYRIAHPYYHHDLAAGYDGTGAWGPIRYAVRTNSLGFRDARVREVPGRTDRLRVLFPGDSFIEGLGIDYDSTFAGLLRRRGIPLTVVVYPWPQQRQWNDRNSLQVRYWREWANRERVEFIKLFGAFFEAVDRLGTAEAIAQHFISGDMHWNASGHRLVTEILRRRLIPIRRSTRQELRPTGAGALGRSPACGKLTRVVTATSIHSLRKTTACQTSAAQLRRARSKVASIPVAIRGIA